MNNEIKKKYPRKVLYVLVLQWNRPLSSDSFLISFREHFCLIINGEGPPGGSAHKSTSHSANRNEIQKKFTVISILSVVRLSDPGISA